MSSADRYRRLIHPLFAVLLPASFLIPLSALITGFLAVRLPALSTAAAVCLGTGFLAALFQNIAREERLHTPGRFRVAFVLLALCYLIVSLFRDGPLLLRFYPGFENIWFAFFCGVQWLLTTAFQETFRAREYLLEEMEGREGTALTIAIRDATTLTGKTLSGLKILRMAAVLFSLSLAVILITIDTYHVRIDTGIAAASLASFLLLPFVAALTSQYAFEHDAACEGFPVDEALRSRKLRLAFVIVLIPLLLSPFVCGDEPPLPPELLLRFLAWLADLFAFKSAPLRFTPEVEPGQGELIEELLRMREEADTAPGFDLSWLLPILKRLFLIAAVLAIAAFVLAPLISKHFRAALKKRSLIRFLLRKLREIATLFRFARRKKEARVRVGSDDLAPVRAALAALTRGRKTRQKKRELGRMTKIFLELIQWGTARTVPYAPSTAPGEYVRALMHLEPTRAADFLTAGDAFEEALYSDHLLDARRFAEYEEAVRRVLAPKPEL